MGQPEKNTHNLAIVANGKAAKPGINMSEKNENIFFYPHGCDSHNDVRQPMQMHFADSSVYSELIFMTFCLDN